MKNARKKRIKEKERFFFFKLKEKNSYSQENDMRYDKLGSGICRTTLSQIPISDRRIEKAKVIFDRSTTLVLDH